MVGNSSSSMLSEVNQSALTTHNWGLHFCGGVPCESPQEVVHDAIAMNVTSRNSATIAKMWDNSQEISIHEWLLVSLGNISRVDDLVEPLVVDFSSS